MGPSLTVRNLTSIPLQFKLIERFEAATKHSKHSPSSTELAENAQSFSRKDVDVLIPPFAAHTADAPPASEKPKNETLRITVECDGERYRLDIPHKWKDSLSFAPLHPNPKFLLTGVFLKDEDFLSVYSSANLQAWMKELDDETPLSALSIPGTHNTPTCYSALPSVRCQAVSPLEQLQNGVRFFDIRVQPQSPNDPSKDGLILVHGVFPISLTGNKYLRHLLDDVYSFLDDHPSETLIISLKREGPGNATDQQLSRILFDHYANDLERWYTAPRVPHLGEVRKKVVLMRRFALDDSLKEEYGGVGWAIDAECWRYNCDHDLHGNVCVQDFCEVNETEQIEDKIRYAQEHLDKAGQCVCPLPAVNDEQGPQPLYLNFLSASNFWRRACWPEKIAAKLNPAMVKHLCMQHYEGEGDGSTGIVVCDWVGLHGDWDLIRCIVGMNARLLMKRKSVQ